MEGEVEGFDAVPIAEPLPPRARLWGDRYSNSLSQLGALGNMDMGSLASLYSGDGVRPKSPRGPTVTIDNSRSCRITIGPVNVKALQERSLPLIWVVASEPMAGRDLDVRWEARSGHIRGVSRGQLAVQVEGVPKTADEILREPPSYE